jgi:predicted ATP-grasp superfamily ATP-dependent carboligase
MNESSPHLPSSPSFDLKELLAKSPFQERTSKMQKVLVLDGEQRSALATTRSLGKKGIHVVVGGWRQRTLAGHSKYCAERLLYPSPAQNPEDFMAVIREEIRRREITVLLPMTEVTTWLVLKERSQFNGASIPFAAFQLFDNLLDKWKVLELARELGVRIPATHFVRSVDELRELALETNFPVVLKPYRSRIRCENRWIEASVKYANSPRELFDLTQRYHCFAHHPFMIQELIQGQGQGIFALYKQGTPLAFFAHKRLREKPPTGGVSVLSESVEMNAQAFVDAKKILDQVRWHGVAMVEFKVTDSGVPYLMEINPRFWGSLQLAIDAGVDFPWLTYQIAADRPVEAVPGYRIGVRNRWLLGDVAHLYSLFVRNGNGPRLPFSEKWQSLTGFLNFFDASTRYEINRWGDLKPCLIELEQFLIRR